MPAPSGKTQTHFEIPLSLVEARMNSKAAQLTKNVTEIVRLFARFAPGASFLSAVADPREGDPGMTRSDLLVINKIDLAPLVGANLGVMEADTLRMRAKRPFVFTNFKSGEGVDQIAKFVIEKGGLAKESDTLIR